MATLTHIILYSLIGGLVSMLGGILLLSRKTWAEKLAIYATPFAAGALLAAVFLDLLHEGVAIAAPDTVLLSTLIGILIFFIAELFLRWFHHHHQHNEPVADPSATLVVAGDVLHNAIDGIVIAAAFLVSVPTGIVTTLAVAAHEIPQEIGDFALLLSKGLQRKSVLLINVVSALATTVAAVVTFTLGTDSNLPVGVLLGLSAGFLLYIAMSDVIPTIHRNAPARVLSWQPVMLLIGVVTVGLAINLAHGFLEVEHESAHEHENSIIQHDD